MSLDSARLVNLSSLQDTRGTLCIIEGEQHVPFAIERVYYLCEIPTGQNRGAHAHKKLQQLVVAVAGTFEIELDDGWRKQTFTLDSPTQGLYIPAGLWRDLKNFSPGAVCLVLASMHYSEEDYYRDYQKYLQIVQGTE